MLTNNFESVSKVIDAISSSNCNITRVGINYVTKKQLKTDINIIKYKINDDGCNYCGYGHDIKCVYVCSSDLKCYLYGFTGCASYDPHYILVVSDSFYKITSYLDSYSDDADIN